MFNRTAFNKTSFNYMDLSAPIELLGNINSYSDTVGNLFRIIPLSKLLSSSSNVSNLIDKRSELYANIINISFTSAQLDKLLDSIATISINSSTIGDLSRILFQNGEIYDFSNVEGIIRKDISIMGNLKSESSIYSDICITFDVYGNLISNTNINASIGKLSNVESAINNTSNTKSNILRNTYIKSDIQIVSEILSDIIKYKIKNSINLNGSFDIYNNIAGEFDTINKNVSIFNNQYLMSGLFESNNKITAKFITELLMKGVM